MGEVLCERSGVQPGIVGEEQGLERSFAAFRAAACPSRNWEREPGKRIVSNSVKSLGT